MHSMKPTARLQTLLDSNLDSTARRSQPTHQPPHLLHPLMRNLSLTRNTTIILPSKQKSIHNRLHTPHLQHRNAHVLGIYPSRSISPNLTQLSHKPRHRFKPSTTSSPTPPVRSPLPNRSKLDRPLSLREVVAGKGKVPRTWESVCGRLSGCATDGFSTDYSTGGLGAPRCLTGASEHRSWLTCEYCVKVGFEKEVIEAAGVWG